MRAGVADGLYSHAVSFVREPIEALFSWLNEKTNIQRASKCCSTCGLLIHTMGKVAIAFFQLLIRIIITLPIYTSYAKLKYIWSHLVSLTNMGGMHIL